MLQTGVDQAPPPTTDQAWIVHWLLENPLLAGVVVSIVVMLITVGRWTQKVESAAKDFRSFMEKTFPDFQEEMRKALGDLSQRIPMRTVRRGSPLELTEFGRLISSRLEAEAWAAAVAKDLKDETAGCRPFEIDAACVAYIEQQMDPEFSRQISEVAYDVGVPEDGVLDVLRVVLRDELLRLHGLGTSGKA